MVNAQLEKQDIEQISDLLYNSPATDQYNSLKDRLISAYEESDSRQLQKLLSEIELGDQKPTQLLRRMRTLAQDKVPDSTLRLMRILEEYPGITRITSMKLTPKHDVEHFIETNGPPLHCRARPIAPHRYKQVRKEFENMIEQGICRQSKSPWSSPLHVVPKKNGELRVFEDYRRLNSITTPDRYPIP
ncbi:unnamed protein product [Parnassius mnemosyne]|uniref:Uncharacterized protein n=1 Tax=Parnassius mnemosyne TaxID=213953 RepID=A0AAV1LIG2_9NEOP